RFAQGAGRLFSATAQALLRFFRRTSGHQAAAAAARRARTPTRWARYSALPWISPARPSAGIDSSSSDFGENRFLSAASNSGTRNTPDAPAPVTATRTSEGRLATNTPTSAKRDAGLRNFW